MPETVHHLTDRLDELERRVGELTAALEAGGDRRAPDGDRAAVVAAPPPPPPSPLTPQSPQAGIPALDPEIFWVVDGLRSRVADPGGVVFGGAVTTPRGPIVWQYGATSDDLMSRDWAPTAGAIAALGHPARLAILQHVLAGVTTATELSAAADLGSTGQVYHHLTQLVAHGWLAAGSGRGQYVVPAQRVVPLLVIVVAAGGVA